MRVTLIAVCALVLTVLVPYASAGPPTGPAGTVPAAKVVPASAAVQVTKVDHLAGDITKVMVSKWKRSYGRKGNFARYAALFVKYGRQWKVDPVIVACVAFAESRFRAEPPKLMRTVCRQKLYGCRNPGPCYRHGWKKVCKEKWINTAEAGMMQVLWYDGSTRAGYKACTGKKLFGWRWAREKRKRIAQARLSVPKVAICVGSYELSKWKKWALYGGYGKIRCKSRHYKPKPGAIRCHKRMKPRHKWNVKFFAKYRGLRKHFWVSFYNWGSNSWKGNFYPRRVLYCYRQYKQALRLLVAKRNKTPAGTRRAQIKK
jgi:hypothetical protein